MVELVKDVAKQAAESTLRNVWHGGFPVDPYRVARDLGIRVNESVLPDNVSGFIRKRRNEDAVIFISARDSDLRKRFTVAHEIGHYIERTDIQNQPDEDFSFVEERKGAKHDVHEFFANEFAGNLLMPEKILREVSEVSNADGIRVASYFGVSVPAAKTRMLKLGLLK